MTKQNMRTVSYGLRETSIVLPTGVTVTEETVHDNDTNTHHQDDMPSTFDA